MADFSMTTKAFQFFEKTKQNSNRYEEPFGSQMEFWWICVLLGIRWNLLNNKAKSTHLFVSGNSLIKILSPYRDRLLALWFQKYCKENSFDSKEEIKKAIDDKFSDLDGSGIPAEIIEEWNAYAYGGYVYIKSNTEDSSGSDVLCEIHELFKKEPGDIVKETVSRDEDA